MTGILEARVSEVVVHGVVTVDEDATLEVAARHMVACRVGAAVVVHGAHHAGLLSERDIVERVGAGVDPSRYTAGDAMTAPLIVAGAGECVREVLSRMATLGIRHLPVVDAEGHLVGMAALDALVQQLFEDGETIDLGDLPHGPSRWFG